MAKHLIAIISGVYVSFLNFLGSTYMETAVKGLIGGVMGYLGTVLMTWIIKKLPQRIKATIKKLKNRNQ
jgi:hypothetical protein